MTREGQLLWQPSAEFVEQANITRFMRWLAAERDLQFQDYNQLWQWSVDELSDFWQCLWDYFEVHSTTPYDGVLRDANMPGAQWFPGAHLNYAEHLLRKAQPDKTALYAVSELRPLNEISWHELQAKVRILATQLRALGVQPGDRIAAYMPSIPETVIALLATASIGAIWSSCSPDFGSKSVLDRWRQIAPKVLFTIDGYRYGGKDFDRRAEVARIARALPSLEHVILQPYLVPGQQEFGVDNVLLWDDLLTNPDPGAEQFGFAQVPFDHPLWIVFSSGTTGLPKAIVHGHGGIVLEALKSVHFHFDLNEKSNVFFYTTTGWIVWLCLVNSLISGSAVTLYDGNPLQPESDILWRLAEQVGATFFGASPSYIQLLSDHNISPKSRYDLSRLEGMFITGSPMSPEHMAWCYEHIRDDLWVGSQSGGTDIASLFVGAIPIQPVHAGEIQVRGLGVDVHAFNDVGQSVIDEVGELVCCQPMPSMPLYFWNDPGNERYQETYFSMFPGVWRHGDFLKINPHGGCYIYGRSDATLNRHGVRIGTAEIYRAVEALAEVSDSLIINLDLPGGGFFMPLFVVLAADVELDDTLVKKIQQKLRDDCSPRHVPDQIYAIQAVPYTLTGKKLEVPVRKILLGESVEASASRDAMANPEALEYFTRFAGQNKVLLS